jgi:hypothetical protein
LAGLGGVDASLDEESREAADRICKSTDYLSSFKPFGILWMLTTVSMAFVVSSPDRRVAIINAVHELFSLLLFKIRPVVMHQTFNLLTDGIGQ